MIFYYTHRSCPVTIREASPGNWCRSWCRDPQQGFMWRESKLEVSTSSLLMVIRGPQIIGGELEESERMGNARITWYTKSTNKGSYGLTDTEEVIEGSSQVCIRLSVYMLWMLAWYFHGILKNGNVSASLTLCLLLRFYSSYLFALFSLHMSAFALYCILFCLVCMASTCGL